MGTVSRAGPRRAAAVVAVMAVALPGLVTVASAWPPVAVATAVSLCLIVMAAEVDHREMRIPDRLVVAAAVPLAALLLAGGVVERVDALGPVLLGGAFVAVPIGVLHLVSPSSMGFGDVKAGAVVGAAVGVIDPTLALVSVCAASGSAAAWAVICRRKVVAFGPFLAGAPMVVLVVAALMGIEAAAWH